MKNDRLSSLGLMHIHRDFEVDLYKAMEVFVSAKHEGQNLTILRYSCLSVIKIVLDSMLYETLKWPQIAPFCISSNIIMACTLLSLIYPLIEAFNWRDHKRRNPIVFPQFIQSMLLAYIERIEPLVASAHAQMHMKQAKTNSYNFLLLLKKYV
jgi:hypothetical protein